VKAYKRGKIGKRAFHTSDIFHQAEVLFVVGNLFLILQEANDICAYRPIYNRFPGRAKEVIFFKKETSMRITDMKIFQRFVYNR
jgi:hypothetical protein